MKVTDPKARKAHWHLVAFSVPAAGAYMPLSLFMSTIKRSVAKADIDAMRNAQRVPDNAVVLSTSYLGLMTQYEFTGTSPAPVPSVVSAQYLQGLSDTAKAANPLDIECPYPDAGSYEHEEWQKGAGTGRLIRNNNPELAFLAHNKSLEGGEEHY